MGDGIFVLYKSFIGVSNHVSRVSIQVMEREILKMGKQRE